MADVIVTGRHRLTPRAEAPPRVRGVFAELVESVEPEHFRRCDAPVVERMASAVITCRDLEALLERDGPVREDGSLNPVLRALRQQQGIVATLASRLRLTPSSRHDRKTAGTTTRTPAVGVDAAYEFVQRSRRHA